MLLELYIEGPREYVYNHMAGYLGFYDIKRLGSLSDHQKCLQVLLWDEPSEVASWQWWLSLQEQSPF